MGCSCDYPPEIVFKETPEPSTISRRSSLSQIGHDHKTEFPKATILAKETNYFQLIFDLKQKDVIMPLWVTKGKYIKFQVKGKWRIDDLYPWCSSEGFPSNTLINTNYGSLMARIGDSQPFIVKNNYVHLALVSGPLSFYATLPKQKMNPSGSLKITIYDVEKLALNQLYSKLGWIEAHQTNEKMPSYLSQAEFDLIMDINDLRLNPVLFHKLIIANSSRRRVITKEYLEMKNKNIGKELIINRSLCEEANKLFEVEELKNLPKVLEKSNLLLILDYVHGKIQGGISNAFPNNKITIGMKLLNNSTGINMILSFLFDNQLRDLLFDKSHKSIAVKIVNKYKDKGNLIVLIMSD